MTLEIRLAHLSDWHATTLSGGGAGLLQPKRISGWLSWRLRRRRWHRADILAAAMRDVQQQDVDYTIVTGDLTHVSLESEFREAAGQLAALGPDERVFLIPGNHDCYVPVSPARSWDHWSGYLRGTRASDLEPALAECLAAERADGRAPRHADYPTLRVHGALALVGLCSAIPVPIFRAGGQLGGDQLERLERLLARLRERDLARVVMLHHPIVATDESPRRALWDAADLRGVLERQGADLVVHGHKHRRRVSLLEGPDGPIPVIGVPSASEVGSRPDKLAQYHLFTLRREGASGRFGLEARVRGYDGGSGRFVALDDALF